MNRRKVLKMAGATVVVAGAGLAWRAWDNGAFSAGTGPAYEPWRTWGEGQPGDPMRLVHAAILAANPHNSQPWLFKVRDGRIDVFADTKRNIGTIDPFLREMTMGIGCAIENLRIAALADGFAPTVRWLPEAGNATHLARVELAKAAPAPSELYDAIPKRHTNRAAYDTSRGLAADQLAALAATDADLQDVKVLWFVAPQDRARVGEQVVAATEAIIADKQQSEDSGRWFRWGWDEVQSQRDGLSLDAQQLPPLINFAAKVLPPMSNEQADAGWLKSTREIHVPTAAAFGMVAAADGSDPAVRLRAGQLWQRLHLRATAMGLAAHPLNQLPERADRERQLGIEPRFGNVLKEFAGDAKLGVLMPFRIGHPLKPARPSPRRDLKSVLV
jgi:nitroreductase